MEERAFVVEGSIEAKVAQLAVVAVIDYPRTVASEQERCDRQEQFIDQISVHKCAVQRRASFEENRLCSALTKLLQRVQ